MTRLPTTRLSLALLATTAIVTSIAALSVGVRAATAGPDAILLAQAPPVPSDMQGGQGQPPQPQQPPKGPPPARPAPPPPPVAAPPAPAAPPAVPAPPAPRAAPPAPPPPVAAPPAPAPPPPPVQRQAPPPPQGAVPPPPVPGGGDFRGGQPPQRPQTGGGDPRPQTGGGERRPQGGGEPRPQTGGGDPRPAAQPPAPPPPPPAPAVGPDPRRPGTGGLEPRPPQGALPPPPVPGGGDFRGGQRPQTGGPDPRQGGPQTGGPDPRFQRPETGGPDPSFRRGPPQVNAPLPPPPMQQNMNPIRPEERGSRRIDDFRGERRESQEGGRTVFREPGRIIVQDPSGQSYIRHNEVDRFRYGARDVRVEQRGAETRTVVVRPDGTRIITVTDRDGRLLRRIRQSDRGPEVVIIDNSFRGARGAGGFLVDLPPPAIRMPRDRYIVESDNADPALIYETLIAPPVERIERRYSLDEVRYSPSVRDRMPRIDVDAVTFESGSWEVTPDQAAKLQYIADGLNRAISRNPREVFLIEGHTDATGNDVDNLSLSDRRAQAVAEILTQQFQVPPENLTSQGYGEQYLKIPTDASERQNRRVAVRRITPLLTGQTTNLPPPPPGTRPAR